MVLAGAFVEKEFATETMAVQETGIAGAECSTMTEDGILFSPYGIIMPKLYNSDCGIFLFRYLISQSTDTEWKNAEVKIEVPDGWKVQYKQFYHWDYQPVFSDNKAVCMAVSYTHLDVYKRQVFSIPQKETVQSIYQILCTDLPDHYFAEFYCKRFGNYQYVKNI